MKSLINIFYKRAVYLAYFLYACIYLRVVFACEYRHGQLRYLTKEDYIIWKKAFLCLLKEHCMSNYGLGKRKLLIAFATAKIMLVRNRQDNTPDLPIVILCVKNDLQRIKMLVSHYRSIGIKHFAFLDNGSTDGTFEWLQEQLDIDLYTTCEQYSSFVKEAWINRIIAYYGFERWYILTDSDELVAYFGMENHSIIDVICYAQNFNIKRVKALTLDMYADNVLFSTDFDDEIQKKYCWMDSDSYIELERKVGSKKIVSLIGGPRARVMGTSPTLMKYPLIYFQKGMISADAHFQYPYKDIPSDDCYLAILHYKFMGNDKEEYIRRANTNSGFSAGISRKNGGYYRLYLEAINSDKDLSFMYSGSVKYDNSNSLKHISKIKTIPLGEVSL